MITESELDAVRRELEEHIRLTRLEEGCLRFEVTPDEIEPNRFNVYEEFVDRAAFERHQQRAGNSAWAKTTKNVSRYYEIEGLE